MVRLPSEYWRLDFVSERRRDAWYMHLQNMDAKSQWLVKSVINQLIHHKKPWNKFKMETCSGCRDGLYVMTVSHSGLAGIAVEVTVWFDVQTGTLMPIDCEAL